MNVRPLAVFVFAAVTLLAGGWSVAAEKGTPSKPPASMQGMDAMQMDERTMPGMMQMMSACSRMMQGGSPGNVLPRLPPGNDKLQLQMHAEMLQKLGEIESKYATQIKDDKK